MLKKALAVISMLVIVPQAFADRGGDYVRVNVNLNLDQRVYELERVIGYMDQRIRNLEDIVASRPPMPPPPPVAAGYTCMLVDSGYSKTFYGKGRTALEAEFEAKQACSKEVSSSYCQKATKCSSGQADPYVKGYMCVLTDSGYGKIFKGEGSDAVEAEAKVKQSCQSAVSGTYCGNVQPRCEAIR